MLDINHLQQHIPSEIYNRGLSYYQQQLVTDLYEVEKGIWHATVIGTEDYDVRVQLKENNLVKATCTCPHDADICKHIAATLMAIQDEKGTGAEYEVIPEKKKGTKTKEGKQKVPPIKELIQKLSKEELQKLVLDFAGQSRDFKNFLTVHLLPKGKSVGKESYRQIISQAVAPYKRRGFIEYNESFKAMQPLIQLADEAEAQLEKGFYREAFDISSALVEAIAEIVQYMDDSAGFITDLGNSAFGTLHQIVTSDAPYTLKEEIFQYALQERKKEKYKGWDWPDDLFELAVAAANEEQQYQVLLQEIEDGLQQAKFKKEAWTREYETKLWLKHKIAVLQKMNKPAEAQKVIHQNLDVPEFRKQLIQEHIQAGRWTEAILLCEEALQRSLSRPTDWYSILLHIAQQRNDTEGIRRWSANLFLKTNLSLEYFRIYKSTFPKDEWPQRRDQLFGTIQKEHNTSFYRISLAHLYLEEQLWEELLEEFMRSPSIDFLEHYDKYLIPHYPEQVLDTYERALTKYAAEKQGREHYVHIRKILNRLQKIKGGDIVVQRLVQQFRQNYKQRRAMMEELNKLVL
ncbi:MAG: SWIM zinc finger family protein [Flavisolibacter sp.]|nr:SWIM zinc finger family protein [Flavisolibacter sp.]